jgi:hypothetical protein
VALGHGWNRGGMQGFDIDADDLDIKALVCQSFAQLFQVGELFRVCFRKPRKLRTPRRQNFTVVNLKDSGA